MCIKILGRSRVYPRLVESRHWCQTPLIGGEAHLVRIWLSSWNRAIHTYIHTTPSGFWLAGCHAYKSDRCPRGKLGTSHIPGWSCIWQEHLEGCPDPIASAASGYGVGGRGCGRQPDSIGAARIGCRHCMHTRKRLSRAAHATTATHFDCMHINVFERHSCRSLTMLHLYGYPPARLPKAHMHDRRRSAMAVTCGCSSRCCQRLNCRPGAGWV